MVIRFICNRFKFCRVKLINLSNFCKTVIMNCIKDVNLVPLKDSKYVTPLRMEFTENDTKRQWDLVQIHPSVTIVIYNTTRCVLVCVKQFRAGVYLTQVPESDRKNIDCKKYPRDIGLTLEWCSGIIDKDKSLEEIACDEILEECGYSYSPDKLERVQTFRCSVGVSGDQMTLFYAEVTDEMKVSKGGGLAEEGELIDVIELPITEALQLLKAPKVNTPADFLYGLMWFYVNKVQKITTTV